MNEKNLPDSPLCFVVMGFGRKTNYETGKTIDLDKTYEAIIQPAAEAAGFRCVRADGIQHTGIIDRPMYEMLLQADLVIADVSTGNVNAIYELGVRHGLRPNSTIVMMDGDEKPKFDLNHLAHFFYEHLGKDIGQSEAKRASAALTELIRETITAKKPDSPVYTYIPELSAPRLSDEEFVELVEEVEALEENLSRHLSTGQAAMRENRFEDAVAAFTAAEKLRPSDSYIVQQLALATYKSRKPNLIAALAQGLAIINRLAPDNSNDPETLGIAGAIHKRLWEASREKDEIDTAIRMYERGFAVQRDYYNGENLATCLDLRAAAQSDGNEALFDRMSARKVRENLRVILDEIIASPSFEERGDVKWVYATYANICFALARNADGDAYEARFMATKPAGWEVETYLDGKTKAFATAKTSP